MSEEREFEGKDLDEALDIASEQLGVAPDELHYEMLEQGRRGLLGVGTKNVRIRVKPPLETELAEDTAEDNPRRRHGRGRASRAQPRQAQAPIARESKGAAGPNPSPRMRARSTRP